ncbi:MAG: diguanylate cyclase [Butyrivibrio sp.]|nr:diguanylate cyclase [Butyrivibrio sp.]
MKSIQTKLVIFIVICIVLSITIIMVVGLFNMRDLATDYSEDYMEQLIDNKIGKTDSVLEEIEDAVTSMQSFALAQVGDSTEMLDNTVRRKLYLENMEELACSVAKTINGAISVYFRLDPYKYGKNAGFFYLLNADTGDLQKMELTDISRYDVTDREHVAWWYEPMQNGKPCWLEPYFNRNVNKYMISYVIPIYYETRFLGVVGVDIEVMTIMKDVSDITLYDSGYAFVIDSKKNLVYHKYYDDGIEYEQMDEELRQNIDRIFIKNKINQFISIRSMGEDKQLIIGQLRNGMYLGYAVPKGEIYETIYDTLIKTVVFTILLIVSVVTISVVLIHSMTGPLKKLAKASEQMAEGDLKVDLVYKSDDEIGVLAKNMYHLGESLQKYFDYFNKLAYTDELSGLPNKAAFDRDVTLIMDDIKKNDETFELIIMDINFLKRINDSIGHDVGDILISGVSGYIADTFGKSNAYRIGGDEFAAILLKENVGKSEMYIEKLNREIMEYAYKQKNIFGCVISIACGASVYKRDEDNNFSDVFKRADSNMYKNKVQMKAERI